MFDLEYVVYVGVVVVGLGVALLGLQTEANAQAALPQPVQLFITKPACARVRAFDLPASLKTPFASGMTVWVCE